MAEYLTTREVAQYLRLNEKKIYALVAEGSIPGARVSGKWLFPREAIDQWLARSTHLPGSTMLEALLDDLLVLQGSDDWLLDRAVEAFQGSGGGSVAVARVGSLAGLQALAAHRAHVAASHAGSGDEAPFVRGGDGYYRVSLFRRTQGLMLRPGGGVRELADLARGEVRLADRQAMSGTRLLADRLLAGAGVDLPPGRRVGPFSTHLELALAVLNRQADAGFGSQWAAERCGLKFLPLHDEVFALVLPVALASRPRLAAFLEAVLGHVRGVGARGLAGYAFDVTGRMETLGLRLTAEGARR